MSPGELSTAQSSLTVPSDGLVRLGHHPEVAEFGDRPARGQRGQPRAAARLQDAVHLVPVQVVGAPPAPGPDALGEHLDHVVEVFAGQAGVRRRPPHQVEQLVGGPGHGRAFGHELLGQDVQRGRRDHDRVQPARRRRAAARRIPPAHRASSDRAARPGCRSGCGWTARPAAGTWRSCAASRSGTPARPARCRCPARATPSRRAPAGRRNAAAAPPAAAGPGTATRDGRRRGRRARRRAAPPARGRPVRPSGGC